MNGKVPLADNLPVDMLSINVIGQSPAFLKVISTVRQIAGHDVVVSIYGETGTGKELIAHSLHYFGSRASGPFIPVNCGALPDSLFESELFGHEKGAFTDAHHDYSGLIEQADSGTLFLDEIEELSHKGQVALLRFLQDGQYRRVGGSKLRTANVRVIVASNVRLDELCKQPGRFRDDLYYRLNVLSIHIPPLRKRPQDIPLLAQHFLKIFMQRFNKHGQYLGPAGIEWLQGRDWPGNVRELENTIQRGVLLANGNEIRPEHLAPTDAMSHGRPDEASDDLSCMTFNEAKAQAIDRFERDYLNTVLQYAHGNVSRAAQKANKDRRAMGKLIKKHQINPASFSADL